LNRNRIEIEIEIEKLKIQLIYRENSDFGNITKSVLFSAKNMAFWCNKKLRALNPAHAAYTEGYRFSFFFTLKTHLGREISNVNQQRACESGVLFGILIIIFYWLELKAFPRRSRACYFLLLTKK